MLNILEIDLIKLVMISVNIVIPFHVPQYKRRKNEFSNTSLNRFGSSSATVIQ